MGTPLLYSAENYEHPARACPACGTAHTATGQVGREVAQAPAPGDIILCVDCFAVLRVTAEGDVRLPDEAETLTPAQAGTLARMRAAFLARWPGAGSRRTR